MYVKKLINTDIKLVEKLANTNNQLHLKNLEQEFSTSLPVNINRQPTLVFIKGKIDRIDNCAELIRIIDYKSSVKETDKFVFEGFDNLFNDKNYNKQLQLILYAWLLYKNNYCAADVLAPCIIPFKVFLEEPKQILNTDKKRLVFTADFMQEFESHLADFIAKIFDTETAYSQTTDKKTCEYCAYNVICNIN